MMHMTANPFSAAARARALRTLAAAAALSLALPAMAQQVFPSPDAAAEALGDAIARSDGDALQRVLGKQYQSLVPEGSINRDDVYEFLGAWARHHAVQPDGERRALIAVGQSGWTFPVPLAKQKDGWQFDLRAGQQEVRRRRLGRNELVTMETLLQLADAQQRYAEQVGLGRYATQLISAPGKTNGLYWPAASEQDASPIGPDALAMGPDTPAADAFYGYHYRILPPAKGSDAKYGLIAWPARYGDTGVHSFMLGSDRVFYERDLGPGTASRAKAIRSFSPAGWQRVADR
ncbi:DUF2950 domain-containing protein [Cupriavidus necator]|uniref:DUF2950 domain-containing protein n=1 Tax=Cupriavidus necator (strain ATCC 17699 / DSM 428 / KCTC 22496 / NCIMB 10442 / H16 / Stanier 337) TaxID=381666 RepID=Q0JZG7_CUPNH|nr:DUF2950 domain-containing protein [Cupriavidus necator]KUE90633.1 hypothetical protein ASL20_01885 [Cupriavidus necator]QCC04659.1 DUF2950 domain-containing protein [Cupriavidus necator H16]QQB79351.1 DUF2950 domain-containing protein [Cupriavidus necator]WKA43579.1 DUF2950 domain-containing protein [Cupriavidus necator]CAJ96857.1 hypothetical membrane associated protein [Cupriavidus necator H16]